MQVMTKTVQGQSLRYTRIGLGLAALGRPGYINLGHADDLPGERTPEAMLLHAINVLDAAWAAGLRWFDVARSYGRGEEFLHQWLRIRQIDSAELTVSSKWGYTYTANWQTDAAVHEVKEHSLAKLRQQIGESSQFLGPWLRLYQIHSATQDSGVLDNTAVLDELARLRDGGMVIGLSVTGVGQSATLEKALGITRGQSPLFGSVQATWNLLEQAAGPMLQAIHQAGWLVIIKEGLANGRLTERGQGMESPLRQWCEAKQSNVDAVALAAVLAQPFADVVLSGAGQVSHLQSNLEALKINTLEGLPDLQEASAIYWSSRSKLVWQ
jgi:aryl-alcohol dehydrogenase-like predicted oxidoreductase